MKRAISLLSICFACTWFCACNFSSGKTGTVAAASDTVFIQPVGEPILYPSGSDTLMLNLKDGKATVRIYKQAGQNICLAFYSSDYTRMTGFIASADSMANIRFSQIILPDGQMDGPFGREMAYDLPIGGKYVLLLQENQMAGDPWAGDVQVIVELGK